MFGASRTTKSLPTALLARVKTLPFTLKELSVEDAVWDEIERTTDAERTDIIRCAKLYVAEGYLAAMRGRESALVHFENIQQAVCNQPVYNALLSRGYSKLSTFSPAVRSDAFLIFIFALRRSLEPATFFARFESIFVPLIEAAEAFLAPQLAVESRPIKKVRRAPVKYTHAYSAFKSITRSFYPLFRAPPQSPAYPTATAISLIHAHAVAFHNPDSFLAFDSGLRFSIFYSTIPRSGYTFLSPTGSRAQIAQPALANSIALQGLAPANSIAFWSLEVLVATAISLIHAHAVAFHNPDSFLAFDSGLRFSIFYSTIPRSGYTFLSPTGSRAQITQPALANSIALQGVAPANSIAFWSIEVLATTGAPRSDYPTPSSPAGSRSQTTHLS
ncbi:hypothetical protein C8R47DRAFT_1207651 [Mycena vitilis]|nr:hypothetical protein C8R47DRAFT_1207648 [Mycena vitilis]KAJ6511300.1 hypothetical protein C8R47DRAFT_1207651 [Mycena vitilis]